MRPTRSARQTFSSPLRYLHFSMGLLATAIRAMRRRVGSRSEYSPLAVHAFQVVQQKGPISKPHLKEILGGDLSTAALDRALNELWSRLRITRVDYKPEKALSGTFCSAGRRNLCAKA